MPETKHANTDHSELKAKAKATWATGSYNAVASYLAPAAAHLVRVANIMPGERVLDVATGTGVTAITARRKGAEVVGLDLTPELLHVAEQEADVAGVDGIEWREGDAEALPFRDGEFDVVVSSYGHMFAPRPDITMNEMLRVLKPGGRIAFLTHKANNVAQDFFAATAKQLPAPANAPPSPFLWGDPAVIRERLGKQVRDILTEEGVSEFPMLSPAHYWKLFSTTYGPTMKAIEALGDKKKVEVLANDFIAAVMPHWYDGKVTLDYLVTRAVKQ